MILPVLAGLLSLAGCETLTQRPARGIGLLFSPSTPKSIPRQHLQVGMSKTDVWIQYGFDPDDPNTTATVPEYAFEAINQQDDGQCVSTSYRYWLSQDGKANPYFLTFKSCRMSNYVEVQQEIQRRSRLVQDMPELVARIDEFCDAHKIIDPYSRKILEALMANQYFGLEPLPPCMSSPMLAAIQLDGDFLARQAVDRQTRAVRSASQQSSFDSMRNDMKMQQMNWNLQQIQHNMDFQQMQRRR